MSFIVAGTFDSMTPLHDASETLYDHVHAQWLQSTPIPFDLDMSHTTDTYTIMMPYYSPVPIPDAAPLISMSEFEDHVLNAVMDISMEEAQASPPAGVTSEQWKHLCATSSQCCKRTKKTPSSCCVCMEDIKRRFILPCGHSFHRKCIRQWLNDNHTCPVCRHDVSEQVVIV